MIRRDLIFIGIIIVLLTVLLSSCGPAAKLRRAERLINKAEEQGAKWKIDTVTVIIPVIQTETRLDSIFITKPGDTIRLEKERLKLKYVKLPGDSVYIEGKCEADTIYTEVPVTVTKTIEAKSGLRWWWLIVATAVGMIISALIKLIR